VTREDLQTRLWPSDTYVGFEDGLNNAIRKLRQTFGDSADNPRFIQTVPRHGYRFIAPVSRKTSGERVSAPSPTGAQLLVMEPRSVNGWDDESSSPALAQINLKSASLPARTSLPSDGSKHRVGGISLPPRGFSTPAALRIRRTVVLYHRRPGVRRRYPILIMLVGYSLQHPAPHSCEMNSFRAANQLETSLQVVMAKAASVQPNRSRQLRIRTEPRFKQQ